MANAICFSCLFIAMANVITPLFVFAYCDCKRYKINACFDYRDCKRYKHNVFLFIAMATAITPFVFMIPIVNVVKNNVFLTLLVFATFWASRLSRFLNGFVTVLFFDIIFYQLL